MREVRALLLYPPLQFQPGIVAKPDGSLGLPYLAGALRDAGIPVALYDAAVGENGADLSASFWRTEPLVSGLVRVGVQEQTLVNLFMEHTLIGITSVFSSQATQALAMVRLARQVNPTALIVVGGVHARTLPQPFFKAGADAVASGEAERTIVQVAIRNREQLSQVPGLLLPSFCAFGVRLSGPSVVIDDLDLLPFPAWDLLPLHQYWTIGRPHGRILDPPEPYGSVMTTRGCTFACVYCHISVEKAPNATSGPIGRYRMKSEHRVVEEINRLRELGVRYVYIEDDTLLAKKPRALRIFRAIKDQHLHLADINGVNICHCYRNAGGGRLEPDRDLLETMVDCGFRELSLPFESGSQRILDVYASRKWVVDSVDTSALIRTALDAGLRVSGNYTIGYPDETMDEIRTTLRMAKQHVDAGLDDVNIFLIVPFPGSALYDFARVNGYLPDEDPDKMRWYEPTMANTLVPPETLKLVRDLAWELLNPSMTVRHKRQEAV